MKLKLALAMTTALAMTAPAQAATGWYMSLAAGANWLEDTDFVAVGNSNYAGHDDFKSGWAVTSAIGYDFGAWRTEFEVAYRNNSIGCVDSDGAACVTAGGDVWELSQMFNALYDIPLGGRWTASAGAGIGGVLVVADGQLVNYGSFSQEMDDYVFAGQLIAQAAYSLSDRWSVYADYRYLMTDDPKLTNFYSGGLDTVTIDKTDQTLQIGIRFDLQRDRSAPIHHDDVRPDAPKQFIVFFGFNKSNLTSEAQRVVTEAAAAAKKYGTASIAVVGHTDTVGSNEYNLRLSMRRSQAVKDALISLGITDSAITTGGKGETELMVMTGDAVKEPQNRRATIDLN